MQDSVGSIAPFIAPFFLGYAKKTDRSAVEAHFASDFSIVIQLNRKFEFTLPPFLVIISLQNFAHVMTTKLLCYVQNLVVIIELQIRWDQYQISTKFELGKKYR